MTTLSLRAQDGQQGRDHQQGFQALAQQDDDRGGVSGGAFQLALFEPRLALVEQRDCRRHQGFDLRYRRALLQGLIALLEGPGGK